RKVSRTETIYGLTPDQIFLGMTLFPDEWTAVPMIHIGRQESIREWLGVKTDKARFNDFFSASGQYILKDAVRKAYSLQPIDRSAFDKDLMKIDERVNILNMIFNGSMARLYPMPNDPENHWRTFADAVQLSHQGQAPPCVAGFFPDYAAAVLAAIDGGSWADAEQKIEDLHGYQHQEGQAVIVSQDKVDMEILLNKMNVFSRLTKWYGLLGLVFLVLFFIQIFRPEARIAWPARIATWTLMACFLFHTLGLGIRWYVS